MALKALMLRKKIDTKTKELEALRALDEEFEKREAEIAQAVEEAETEEAQATVDEAIEEFNKDKAENEEAKMTLENEIKDLEDELEAEENKQDEVDKPEDEARSASEPTQKREGIKTMNTAEMRNRFGIDSEFVQRESVQTFLMEVRDAMKNKRALTNVGLTVPTEFLGILRENIENYSKLYKLHDNHFGVCVTVGYECTFGLQVNVQYKISLSESRR